MATKNFIWQGFGSDTHIDAIKGIFEVPNLQQAVLSIAFVNEEGVNLLEETLRPIADKVAVFAGIRNDITSKQGLLKLLNVGVSLYTVDTGARSILFHPKLYLARGENESRMVIGSANLTLGGLNNNIEAGLSLNIDLANNEEKDFVENIERQVLELPSHYPEHVVLIKSEEELEELQKTGRVLDELESLPPRPVYAKSETSKDPISRIKLNVKRIPRSIKKIRIPSRVRTVERNERLEKPTRGMLLLWSSTPLTERDLNIPSGTNTNATGSINLDKGLLSRDIDHRGYFRDEVFNDLEWRQSSKPTVEETEAEFQLVVKGISYGTFTLRIAHTKGTDSEAYRQRNAMTRLSWGTAKEHIARPDLIERTLSLYKDETQHNKFILEID